MQKTICCQVLEAFCGLSVAPEEQEIEGLLLDLLPQMQYFCLIIVLVKGRRQWDEKPSLFGDGVLAPWFLAAAAAGESCLDVVEVLHSVALPAVTLLRAPLLQGTGSSTGIHRNVSRHMNSFLALCLIPIYKVIPTKSQKMGT